MKVLIKPDTTELPKAHSRSSLPYQKRRDKHTYNIDKQLEGVYIQALQIHPKQMSKNPTKHIPKNATLTSQSCRITNPPPLINHQPIITIHRRRVRQHRLPWLPRQIIIRLDTNRRPIIQLRLRRRVVVPRRIIPPRPCASPGCADRRHPPVVDLIRRYKF